MSQLFSRRRFAALAALSLTLFAGACKDDPTAVEEEPEVATMRITFTGGAVITVNSTGVVTGSPTIVSGAPRAFTVEFLNAAGVPDPVVDSRFEASVVPAAGITFARTSAFAGTLSAAAAGTVAVQFGLLHIEENHNDFGPFTVNVVVTAPAP